jgi:hypothetical protein
VAGAEGLARWDWHGSRMDRVTFSTLKPTFCVVSESEWVCMGMGMAVCVSVDVC